MLETQIQRPASKILNFMSFSDFILNKRLMARSRKKLEKMASPSFKVSGNTTNSKVKYKMPKALVPVNLFRLIIKSIIKTLNKSVIIISKVEPKFKLEISWSKK
jgi:hypothetical protein